MPTSVYVLDEVILIPVGWAELLKAWEEGELKPFELVRGLVEGKLGRVRGVKLYGAYFKPETMTATIEYVVDFEGRGSGTASVKWFARRIRAKRSLSTTKLRGRARSRAGIASLKGELGWVGLCG